jgi:hypothetical protein
MAKPHYRSGGRERTGTQHSRVQQSYAREQELARQRTGRSDYEGYGRPYDYDTGSRYTRDMGVPNEPLFGDRLYGDRQNRRRYGDYARDEHRRFAVHDERQHADRDGTASGAARRYREESLYPYGSYGALAPEGDVYDDRNRQALQDRAQYRGRGPRGYQRSDDRIREEVCERLTDDEHIDASDVEITVSNCEVALSGSVRTREQKRRAVDIAEDVSGVHHVRNSLKIG